jgi:hypothetical protein
LHPVYVRGEAYIWPHTKAAKLRLSFGKYWTIAVLCRTNPSVCWRICSLAAPTRCKATPPKARAAYQDFLTLWKDADPDIPVLKQAKAEYTKLQ